MYNDNERNSYEPNYSYRPNYDEPLSTPEGNPNTEPKKSNHKMAKRVTAIVLCGALLIGGSFGAGWLIKGGILDKKEETSIMVSPRDLPEVTTVNVTGSDKLTYTEIYNANVDSCVSINASATGYNFFMQPVKTASSGSGFIITKDGYIVTNYHIISNSTDVEVPLDDGTTYTAQVVGGDESYDLAVLKIDPGDKELQPVVLGSSSSLQVGDEIAAIGNPLGELTFSMSEGIVSCVNREINVDGTPFNMIQITAAINEGNSGGPLFNIYGEVVGIVSAKYSSSSSGNAVEGLGFAIPIDDVLSMIEDIMENGQVTTRPYLGISAYYDSQPQVSGVSAGVYVESVEAGGPAEKAGLQAGDVITMIGSSIITNHDDINSLSKTYKAGDTVTITYVRNGQVATTELTFGSTTEANTTSSQTTQPDTSEGYYPYEENGGSYSYGGDMDDFFEQYFGMTSYSGKNAA